VLIVDDILPNVKLLEAKLTSEYYDGHHRRQRPKGNRAGPEQSPI